MAIARCMCVYERESGRILTNVNINTGKVFTLTELQHIRSLVLNHPKCNVVADEVIENERACVCSCARTHPHTHTRHSHAHT